MHRLLALVLLVTISFDSHSQNQTVLDSLLRGAKKASNDSIRVAYHYELCYQWAAYNFDSAMYHANQMSEIALSSDNSILIFQAFSAQGLAHDYQYAFDSAIHYYIKAQELAEEIGYRKGIAISTFNIGVVYYYSGQMEKAIDNYLEAEKSYLEIDDQRNLGVLYNNLGLIYKNTKKYDLAKDFYLKSLTIKRERGDVNGIMNTLTNLSTIYQFLENYEQAKVASDEVLGIAKEQNNSGAYLAELINLGKIYIATDDQSRALSLYEEAAGMLDEDSPFIFKTEVFHQLSNFYVDQKELVKAKKYLDLVENLVAEDQLDVQMNHYLTFSRYHKATGQNSNAYTTLQKAFDIRESIFDNEVLEKTTELEQLYEKEKREAEIARLNAEQDLNTLTIEKSQQERNVLIAISILVVMLAVLFFVLFRQKRKSLLEREILLKEIHHRVKNNLQIISSLLNLQAGSLDDEVAIDAVKEGQNRVKSMALIHENLYKNDNLSGIEVDDYIKNLTDTLYHSFGVDTERIKTELSIEKLKLDIDTLIPLGLILNELVSNSLKYAFPNGEGILSLTLHKNSDALELQLKDNGPGLDEEKLESGNSYGWKMVKSLSRKLKADVLINNEEGTEISMKIKNYKLVA